MIKNKEIGLKIAVNEDEAFWENIRENAEEHSKEIIPEQIKALQDEQKLNEAIVEMAEAKINEINLKIANDAKN